MTSPVLIHIGYHKTATSWMQQFLFHPENGYFPVADHADVHRHVTSPHGLWFDPDDMRRLIAERSAAAPPGTLPVVSSEILSGNPHYGAHESDVYAERLKRIAPEAKILISIRAQMRVLPSIYMQYLLRGGTLSHDRYLEGEAEVGYLAFSPDHFAYDRLVALYQSLFGAENVYIQTQEALKADMDGAVRAMAAAVGNTMFRALPERAVKVRAPGYPEYAAPFLRRVNHVQAGPMNVNPMIGIAADSRFLYRATGFALRRPPLSLLLKNNRPVSDYVKRRFKGHFTQSNARLAEISANPLDLSAYG